MLDGRCSAWEDLRASFVDLRPTRASARVFPKLTGDLDRVNAGLLPPGSLIARAMHRAVMRAAERDGEFVARLAAERARLEESEVMRIRWLAGAEEAGLLGHEPKMLLVAVAAQRANCQHALVDPAALARAGSIFASGNGAPANATASTRCPCSQAYPPSTAWKYGTCTGTAHDLEQLFRSTILAAPNGESRPQPRTLPSKPTFGPMAQPESRAGACKPELAWNRAATAPARSKIIPSAKSCPISRKRKAAFASAPSASSAQPDVYSPTPDGLIALRPITAGKH
jgi:hypothetical protein